MSRQRRKNLIPHNWSPKALNRIALQIDQLHETTQHRIARDQRNARARRLRLLRRHLKHFQAGQSRLTEFAPADDYARRQIHGQRPMPL
jgi:hypothetical protein